MTSRLESTRSSGDGTNSEIHTGCLAAGHPVTSYVRAGELTAAGASLATVTALIISWVTVGVANLPAEAGRQGHPSR